MCYDDKHKHGRTGFIVLSSRGFLLPALQFLPGLGPGRAAALRSAGGRPANRRPRGVEAAEPEIHRVDPESGPTLGL